MVDIAGYGNVGRTRQNLEALRAGMYASFEQACATAGIPWDECDKQDNGDGVLIIAPPTVPKGLFAGRFLTALLSELRKHNESHSPMEQIKLRLAFSIGEIVRDRTGMVGPSIIHTQRLLDAEPLKKALTHSPGPLAVIVSSWFYREVVRQSAEYEPDSYKMIQVRVKETSDVGWIRMPGHDLPVSTMDWRKMLDVLLGRLGLR